jgi:hypothetical protein
MPAQPLSKAANDAAKTIRVTTARIGLILTAGILDELPMINDGPWRPVPA